MTRSNFPVLSADEAAALIPDGATVGFSGFTPAGAAKAVPRALAQRARALHARGESYRLRVLTGASTGPGIDDALANADAISWRAPYQSSKALRARINDQSVEFVDMHLSHVPQMVEFGFFGPLDFAVVEAVDVTDDGRIYLGASIGASPSFLRHAKRVVVEVNAHHSRRLHEMQDIAILPRPPMRDPIPIGRPMAKIGVPFALTDPSKIVGVVHTNEPDGVAPFTPPDAASERIAAHVVHFLLDELHAGRIPPDFLPLQAGVGNVANAVMASLGSADEVPPFVMYTEVFQDALVGLMRQGKLLGASSTSLTLSEPRLQEVYGDMGFFGPRVVLRPQELSNNPGVIRRLGVISINTAVEADLYGCVNSTHVAGTRLLNGVGGSGDFVRNAYISLLVCPSVSKGGAISTIVPMVTHVDHNEHSVQVVVTEQGLADLRGLGPLERAHRMIEKCAHPSYRDYLHHYLEAAPLGHVRHDLAHCFDLHRSLLEHGSMRPAVEAALGGHS
ncbi:MAG: succinate CoA transferase [Proteobacteria bacterium]|nr:succinate CoA transferase [Pseudomonadota bacterium]